MANHEPEIFTIHSPEDPNNDAFWNVLAGAVGLDKIEASIEGETDEQQEVEGEE
jgi:hypothetical protein